MGKRHQRRIRHPKPPLSVRIGDAFDGALSVVAPKLALERTAAREMYALNSYSSARATRPRSGWNPPGGSADEDLLFDLPDLRERSRDLNRNNGQAAGITSTVCVNVIGTGIRTQSRIDLKGIAQGLGRELTEEEIEETEAGADRAFRMWQTEADAGDRLDWPEMQQLAFRQVLENGEAILVRSAVNEPHRRFQHCWQVVESDRLESPPEKYLKPNVRGGVEIGPRGEPVAYYIRRTHPGDYTHGGGLDIGYNRIPARDDEGRPNVLHLYRVERPGQTRGVPFFAPVINYFRDLDKYLEAEIVAARVAACFSVLVKSTSPTNKRNQNTSRLSGNRRIEEIEPGMIEYLGPNEDVEVVNPGRPGNNVEPFVVRMLRMISASLGLPYEQVAKDFSRTTFSSARAALIEAWRMYDVYVRWMSLKLMQPNWELVLEEAVIRGYWQLPPALDFETFRYELTRANHIPPGRAWIDPAKEVKASQEAMTGESPTSTLQIECAKQGLDWEDVLEQRSKEKRRAKTLGVTAAAPAAGPPGAPPVREDPEDIEDEDEDDAEEQRREREQTRA